MVNPNDFEDLYRNGIPALEDEHTEHHLPPENVVDTSYLGGIVTPKPELSSPGYPPEVTQ